jgi:casein kinase II subunit beta
MVPFWKEAMEMVLDVEPGATSSRRSVYRSDLFALQTKTPLRYPMSQLLKHRPNYCTGWYINATFLHARVCKQWWLAYLDLSRGVDSVCIIQVDKYEQGIFGVCPRVYCVGCNVVPCGRSDLPGLDTVKLFCPNCNDIYIPPSSRFQGVDGSVLIHFVVLYIAKAPFRCILWDDIRASFLSKLSRACTSTILEIVLLHWLLNVSKKCIWE